MFFLVNILPQKNMLKISLEHTGENQTYLIAFSWKIFCDFACFL